jgi:hypothetical protein
VMRRLSTRLAVTLGLTLIVLWAAQPALAQTLRKVPHIGYLWLGACAPCSIQCRGSRPTMTALTERASRKGATGRPVNHPAPTFLLGSSGSASGHQDAFPRPRQRARSRFS